MIFPFTFAFNLLECLIDELGSVQTDVLDAFALQYFLRDEEILLAQVLESVLQ